MLSRRSLRRLAVAPLLLYPLVFVMVILGSCADRLLLFPTTHALHGVGSRHTIDFGEGRLELWQRRNLPTPTSEPALFVLQFCGNAERAEAGGLLTSMNWGGQSVEQWTLNYPGFGGSSGTARLDAISRAASAAYAAMRQRAGTRPIIVVGNSIGTTAALYLAATEKPALVVLKNPPPLKRLVLQRHGWWNLWLFALPVAWQIPSALDSLETAPKAKAPALIITAAQDTLVPPSYQDKVYNAYGGPKQRLILPQASHNSPLTLAQQTHLRTWLQSHLPQQNTR